MIGIDIVQVDKVSSCFSTYATVLRSLHERIGNLERRISRQSGTEETLCRLRALEKDLEELGHSMKQMEEVLLLSKDQYVKTEERIGEVYREERMIPVFLKITENDTRLFEQLDQLVRIER